MIGFTKSLAQEIATRNVTVNCVAPGFIESAMTGKLNDKQKEAIMGLPSRLSRNTEDILRLGSEFADISARHEFLNSEFIQHRPIKLEPPSRPIGQDQLPVCIDLTWASTPSVLCGNQHPGSWHGRWAVWRSTCMAVQCS